MSDHVLDPGEASAFSRLWATRPPSHAVIGGGPVYQKIGKSFATGTPRSANTPRLGCRPKCRSTSEAA